MEKREAGKIQRKSDKAVKEEPDKKNSAEWQREKEYLNQTLDIVKRNVENYESEIREMSEQIEEMLQHYHDNDVEVYTQMSNTVTMRDHMQFALMRNRKAAKKPYFGRIDFLDETLQKKESLYIGRGGIAKDTTHQMVVDWRAPVANAYYENGLGECSYCAPDGRELPIRLDLKRTYEIDNGKLLDYFDTEVIANDELLTKYLAKNKQAVLGEIIATIQKEQNDIIRKTPYHNIIVQGVAGSGKTTVAMHRISFILYNYAERFRPEDFYIVGSNRILLEYITGVLPDLDVYGIRQMTMEQLFVRLLYEDWDEQNHSILENTAATQGSMDRGTYEWFQDLTEFGAKIEAERICMESVVLDRRQFVEGLKGGVAGVFDEREGEPQPSDLVELLSGKAIRDYVEQTNASVQTKINMLNERLIIKIKDEFLKNGLRYSEKERKAILKEYRGYFGKRIFDTSIFELYQQFLLEQKQKGYEVSAPEQAYDVYDLAALAYLYKRIKETEVISEAHHVVIDEAQDYGMMAYAVLKYCMKDCTYTVMGDVSQNIHFGFGLADWEELRKLLCSQDGDSFGILKKSYRNTVEISEFATKILHHGSFEPYPVEPIIRHGKEVEIMQLPTKRELYEETARRCRAWQKQGLNTIAIVCRTPEKAELVARQLGRLIPVCESNLEKAVFSDGIMVLPVVYTKGLEFDAVLIFDPDKEEYPVDDGHAKLLYVAATRALHELCVLYREDLTGLIAEPLPEEKQKETDRKVQQLLGEEGTKRIREAQSSGQKVSYNQNGLITDRKEEQGRQNTSGISAESKYDNTIENNNIIEDNKGSLQLNKKYGNAIGKNESQNKLREESRKETSRGTSQGTSREASQGTSRGTSQETRRETEVRFSENEQEKEMRQEAVRPRPKLQVRPRVAATLKKPQVVTPPSQSMLLTGVQPIVIKSKEQKALEAMQREQEAIKAQAAEKLRKEKLRKKKMPGVPLFGDMPENDKLRPAGHAKIDLTIRWVHERPDGLYLQSRYGMLRICPVSKAAVRVSFRREDTFDAQKPIYDKNGLQYGMAGTRTGMTGTHTGAADPMDSYIDLHIKWKYRDKGSMVEMTTPGLLLEIDKGAGNIRFLMKDRKVLCEERKTECRLIEADKSWQFFDWKKEKISIPNRGNSLGFSMKGSARYIHGKEGEMLPMMISDRGYSVEVLNEGPVICCDIPTYGSYFQVAGTEIDYIMSLEAN